ncbi:MAG: tetratricopeptide repeat protein [Gemmatimonadetes bacterium]|nr:tetratricopeptide repeat protein [Gemmatimonadota bacterium]
MNAPGSRGSIAILVACVLLVYANSFEGSFHYDDFHSIAWNPHIRDLGNIPSFFIDPQLFSADPEKGMYRPLLLVTYAINYALSGYEVWSYHWVNVGLHLLCSLLVWGIGRRSWGEGWGALGSGLLFALHPLATEPANYISSRSELLAACFFLSAFLLFISRGGKKTGVALVCFVAGLLSKSVVITLPAVLLFHDWLRREKPIAWGRHLSFWGVGVLYVGVIAWNRFLGDSLGKAPRGLGDQLWTQCKGLVYYLKLLAMPVGLNVEHQFTVASGVGETGVITSFLLLLSLVFFCWRLGKKKELLWVGWAFVVLMPASLIPLNVLVNEHRLYLPLAGMVLLVGETWRGWGGMVGRWSGLVLLCILAGLVFQRNLVWEDELSLWQDAAAKSPGMPRVHVHRGNALLERGRRVEAKTAFETALRFDPAHRAARTNLANLFYEAADGERERSREYLERAAREYALVLEIDPGYREALNNLGSVSLALGESERARKSFLRLVDLYPNFADGYFNLGLVAAGDGDHREAVVRFKRALELRPEAETLYELGNSHVLLGELERGADAYRQAKRSNGKDVRLANNLGEVLLVLGEKALQSGDGERGGALWREASENFQQVVRQDPQYGRAAERLKQLESRLR